MPPAPQGTPANEFTGLNLVSAMDKKYKTNSDEGPCHQSWKPLRMKNLCEGLES